MGYDQGIYWKLPACDEKNGRSSSRPPEVRVAPPPVPRAGLVSPGMRCAALFIPIMLRSPAGPPSAGLAAWSVAWHDAESPLEWALDDTR